MLTAEVMRLTSLLLCCVLALLAQGAMASNMPVKPTLAQALGLHIQPYRITPAQLDHLKNLGVTWVRLPIDWPMVESPKGVYNFHRPQKWYGPTFTIHNVVSNIIQRGLKVVVVLGHGHEYHTGARQPIDVPNVGREMTAPAPTTPEQQHLFAQFAAATVRHLTNSFGKENFIWTIWNEPHSARFWFPVPDVHAYARLLSTTCRSIREIDPFATIVAPGFSTDTPHDYAFFKSLLNVGVDLDCLDAYSWHPYRRTWPETMADDYQKMLGLIAQVDGPQKILVGEMGYPVKRHTPPLAPDTGRLDDTDMQQAALLARTAITNHRLGIPLTIWFEWQNSGDDLNIAEHNFGLIDSAERYKPAFTVMKNLLAQLGSATHWATVDTTCKTAITALRTQLPDGRIKTIAWSNSRPTGVFIHLSSAQPLIDLLGKPHATNPETPFILPLLPVVLTTEQGQPLPTLSCQKT